MSLFNFVDTFFFISLGITFVLILLLVQHFKSRLQVLETKCDTMFDIMNTMTTELKNIKREIMSVPLHESYSPQPQPDSNMIHSLLQNLGVEIGGGFDEIIKNMQMDSTNLYSPMDEPEKIHISDDNNEETIKVISLDLDDLQPPDIEVDEIYDDEIHSQSSKMEDESIHEFRPQYTEDDFKKMNVEQLREMASSIGIPESGKLKKKELIPLLVKQFIQ